jgi:hypothetical protein
MSWSEIIFWLFARLRPLLAYHARLGWMLRVAAAMFEDHETLLWLAEDPEDCAVVEGMFADAEHYLDIIIGLRACELLGLPAFAIRPQRARIHTAPSLERLAARFAWLARRYDDIERLARLRAASKF